MSLPTVTRTSHELAEREAALGDMLSPNQLRVMRDTIRSLVQRGAGDQALRAGAEAPEFILPTADGAPLRLYDQLKSGPVVLVFFRGGWCPFCETYLRGLQRELLYFPGTRRPANPPSRLNCPMAHYRPALITPWTFHW